MKCPFYISLLLCCIIGAVSCTGPVIIEEEEEEEKKTEMKDEGESTDEETHERDSVAIIHEGTYSSPYSVGEAQTLGRGKSLWIEGYIVGSVSGSMKNGCDYTAEAVTTSNILLADTFPTGSEYDYLYCMPVELPNNSIERDDLNLYDNPDNYHRKVRIEGDITLYYKVSGIKNITDYTFRDKDENEENEEKDDNNDENGGDNGDEEKEPDTPHDPDATRQDTLSIAEAIKPDNKGEQPYIRGYIIGYYNGSSMVFNPTIEQISPRAQNNVVLADNIKETDRYNVIIVELPTNTALRSNVNLKDNPENLHRRLTVKGILGDYKETSYHGCMGTLSKLGDDEDYYFSIE